MTLTVLAAVIDKITLETATLKEEKHIADIEVEDLKRKISEQALEAEALY
jgi:hypothetical protein